MYYDITVITKEEKDINHAKNIIEEYGGVILQEKKLGIKKFAYPIKKMLEGYYTVFIFEVDAQNLENINKELVISPIIIRHLIISTDKEGSTIQDEAKEQEDDRIRKSKIDAKKQVKVEVKKIEKPTKAQTKEEEKQRQEALEEKLGEILNE